MKPTRFIWLAAGASSGTTLTSGLPALAMMNGSPLAARSTSRESCVLASWILTVRMVSLDELSLLDLVHRFGGCNNALDGTRHEVERHRHSPVRVREESANPGRGNDGKGQPDRGDGFLGRGRRRVSRLVRPRTHPGAARHPGVSQRAALDRGRGSEGVAGDL